MVSIRLSLYPFEPIYQALSPGGIFIFDILELEPVSRGITQGFREGEDWIVLLEKKEDREQKKLTRRITNALRAKVKSSFVKSQK